MTLTESGRFRFCVRWLGQTAEKGIFHVAGLTAAGIEAAEKLFVRAAPSALRHRKSNCATENQTQD